MLIEARGLRQSFRIPLVRLARSRIVWRTALAAGVAIRLVGGLLPGTPDVESWQMAGSALLDHGRYAYWYSFLDNPPLSYAVFAESEALFRHVLGALPRTFAYNLVFNVVLAIALWAAWNALRKRGRILRARLIVLLIWLNPAVLVASPFLGYADPVFASTLLLACLAVQGRRALVAGAFLGVSLAIKPTGAVVIPVLLVSVWSWGWVRLAAFTAAMLSAAVAPFLALGTHGGWRALVVTSCIFQHPMISGQAFNAWWIVQWLLELREALRTRPTLAAVLEARARYLPFRAFSDVVGFDMRLISLALVGTLTLWNMWLSSRRSREGAGEDAFWMACSAQMVIYTCFGHSVHENHLFPFFLLFPFAAVLARDSRRRRERLAVLGLFSLLYLVNLLSLYPFVPYERIPMDVLRPPGLPDLTVLYSMAFVALGIFFLRATWNDGGDCPSTCEARSVLIEARGLRKAFSIPSEERRTVREHLFGALRRRTFERVQVLDGVDLELRAGETLGIMGRNGSGKTTLLKILCGIYRADAGELAVRAPITPLLELGIGWNPDLDAVDNVLLMGTIMGMSLAEARRAVPEILDFAQVERFANLELKHYSSGMAARLAYAVAFRAVREILVIDEIFAVGDVGFKARCEARYRELAAAGHTTLLVSHDPRPIETFCHRAVLLEAGRIALEGSGTEVAVAYAELARRATAA